MGFDDLPFAPCLTPALTTIRTDGVHQGQMATQMLFERLNGRNPAIPRVRLEPDVIIRASTGSAKP